MFFFPQCKLFFFTPNQKQTIFFLSGKLREKKNSPPHITPPFCQFCKQPFYFYKFASLFLAEQSLFVFKKKDNPPHTYHLVGPLLPAPQNEGPVFSCISRDVQGLVDIYSCCCFQLHTLCHMSQVTGGGRSHAMFRVKHDLKEPMTQVFTSVTKVITGVESS